MTRWMAARGKRHPGRRNGKDKLTGGAGKDYFLFDTAPVAGNEDKITDFKVKDDTILLDDAVFTALSAGPLATTAFSPTRPAPPTMRTTGSSTRRTPGKIFYDADGDQTAPGILIATIGKNLALTSQDFTIV